MPTPRRRWFRLAFSLRTLFVLVTLVTLACGWVGWQVRIVRARQSLLKELTARDDVEIEFSLSSTRWQDWLGDKPVEVIYLDVLRFPKARENEIRETFPEADIGAVVY